VAAGIYNTFLRSKETKSQALFQVLNRIFPMPSDQVTSPSFTVLIGVFYDLIVMNIEGFFETCYDEPPSRGTKTNVDLQGMKPQTVLESQHVTSLQVQK